MTRQTAKAKVKTNTKAKEISTQTSRQRMTRQRPNGKAYVKGKTKCQIPRSNDKTKAMAKVKANTKAKEIPISGQSHCQGQMQNPRPEPKLMHKPKRW